MPEGVLRRYQVVVDVVVHLLQMDRRPLQDLLVHLPEGQHPTEFPPQHHALASHTAHTRQLVDLLKSQPHVKTPEHLPELQVGDLASIVRVILPEKLNQVLVRVPQEPPHSIEKEHVALVLLLQSQLTGVSLGGRPNQLVGRPLVAENYSESLVSNRIVLLHLIPKGVDVVLNKTLREKTQDGLGERGLGDLVFFLLEELDGVRDVFKIGF